MWYLIYLLTVLFCGFIGILGIAIAYPEGTLKTLERLHKRQIEKFRDKYGFYPEEKPPMSIELLYSLKTLWDFKR